MPRLYNYTIVDKLPENAIKVSEYAKKRGCSTSLIYHEISRNKAQFEIIQFQNINFIVPLSNNNQSLN